jgi:hypothetical protein
MAIWKLKTILDAILLLLQMQIICGEDGEFCHLALYV